MSEKELRQIAGHSAGCRYRQTAYMEHPERCTCGLDAILADDPDVVAAAKETAQALRLMGGNPDEMVGPDPLSQEGKIWQRGYRQALADTLSDMEVAFDFCLTDDDKGWKWTTDEQ